MKKLFFILTFMAVFVAVTTSLMSCNNPIIGSTQNGTSQNGSTQDGTNQDVTLEEVYAAFEKLGSYKQVGRIPDSYTRLYELDTVNQKILDSFSTIHKNCGFLTSMYYLPDESIIEKDLSKYNYIEFSDFDINNKTIKLRFVEKGAIEVEGEWLGKIKKFGWKEFANLVGAEEPTTIDEVVTCLDNNLGKVCRYATTRNHLYRLYEYYNFNDKVTDLLKGRELNCSFPYNEYKTSTGEKMDMDYTQYSYAMLDEIDKDKKTVVLRLVEKGTKKSTDGWFGKYTFLTWDNLIKLTK